MEGGLGPEPGAEWLGQAVAGERPGKDPEERGARPTESPLLCCLDLVWTVWCPQDESPGGHCLTCLCVHTLPNSLSQGCTESEMQGLALPLLPPSTCLGRQPGPRVESLRGQTSGGRLTPQWAAQQGPGLTGRWEQRERSVVSQGPSHHRAAIPSDPGPHARGRSEAPGELQESRQPRWRQKRFHARLLPAAGTDKETLQSLWAPSTTSAG